MYDKKLNSIAHTVTTGSFDIPETDIHTLRHEVKRLNSALKKVASNQAQIVNDMQAIYHALKSISEGLKADSVENFPHAGHDKNMLN